MKLFQIDSDQVLRLQISYQNEMKDYDDGTVTTKKKISTASIS